MCCAVAVALTSHRLVISDGEHYIQVRAMRAKQRRVVPLACVAAAAVIELTSCVDRAVLCSAASFLQGMLTTQLNDMVSSGQLTNGSILRLNEYICNDINGKKSVEGSRAHMQAANGCVAGSCVSAAADSCLCCLLARVFFVCRVIIMLNVVVIGGADPIGNPQNITQVQVSFPQRDTHQEPGIQRGIRKRCGCNAHLPHNSCGLTLNVF